MMGTYNLLDLTPKGRDEEPGEHGLDAPPRPLRIDTGGAQRPARARLTPEGERPVLRTVMASASAMARGRGVGAPARAEPCHRLDIAAAWGVQSRDRSRALRALMPIAVGHGASVALVAAAVALGLAMDHVALQALAGGLLVVVAIVHLSGRTPKRARAPAGHTGLALWSFMMSSAHGAGLMLVPALIPLCIGDAPGRPVTASGSLTVALAAVGVHTAAMLAVTGLIATGVCQGFDAGARLLRSLRPAPR